MRGWRRFSSRGSLSAVTIFRSLANSGRSSGPKPWISPRSTKAGKRLSEGRHSASRKGGHPSAVSTLPARRCPQCGLPSGHRSAGSQVPEVRSRWKPAIGANELSQLNLPELFVQIRHITRPLRPRISPSKSGRQRDSPAKTACRALKRESCLLLGLKGWKVNGVWLLKNGTPFSVESGSDGPGFGNVDGQGNDRMHILNPAILGSVVGNPDTSQSVLARCSFAFMGPGESRRSIGRNTFRRGKIVNVNASLQRTWKLPQQKSPNLRGESINLMNTRQFAGPNFNLASPGLGRITNTLNDGRTFRFQLTLGF